MKIAGLVFVVLLIVGALWAFWQYREYKVLTSGYLDRVMSLRTTGEVQVPSILKRAQERNSSVLPYEAVAIRITQRGTILTSPEGSWQAFEAEQTIALGQSGFVWLATAPIFAGLGIEVIDSYDGKSGLLQVRMLGALILASYEGPEADAGELQRYIAELPMSPGAIARNANLSYEVKNDGSVRVWDKTVGEQVWVEVLLDQEGRINEIRTDGRPRGIEGGSVMTEWGGAYSDWTIIDGYEMPRHGEVWWIIDGKKSPYWRGEITSVIALDGAGKPIISK